MGTVLTVAGVLLQLVGAVVALRGLIKTHDAYADKSIRTLTGELIERWRVRAAAALRRLFRRRHDVAVHAGAAEMATAMGTARVTVGYGPLPPKTAYALSELDRRTRDLSTRIDSLGVRIEESAESAKKAMKELRADLEQTAKQANEAVRAAAIEGLMGEAVGLALVIGGGILQAWGALIPSS